MDNPGITLSELLVSVKQSIKNAFPDPVWVRLEVSSMSVRSGYTILEIVDRNDDGDELAKAKAIIWEKNRALIRDKFQNTTGSPLSPGIKILALAQVGFSGQYGLDLVIKDIDPSFTLGDMAARLQRIRITLNQSGEATLNQSLPMPIDFFNVAVISPPDAAGLGDFRALADRLQSTGLCAFSYFHATFQGPSSRESMKEAFVEAHKASEKECFDVLVVIRGGGATNDLNWLNELIIARMVCRFRIPVFVGIGHERDATILDEFANRSFGTPSKVIAHIKEAIVTRAVKADEDWSSINLEIKRRIELANVQSTGFRAEIFNKTMTLIASAQHQSDRYISDVRIRTATIPDLVDSAIESMIAKIRENSLNAITLATANIGFRFQQVSDGARSAVTAFDEKVGSIQSFIKMTSLQTGDKMRAQIDHDWASILESSKRSTSSVQSNADRYFEGVCEDAARNIKRARQTVEELISHILSHGVEPTLKRGYALVTCDQKPISTLEEAQRHDQLKITFKDGSIITTPKKQ